MVSGESSMTSDEYDTPLPPQRTHAVAESVRGRRMRPARQTGVRRWLLRPAVVLVASGLAVGCGSSTPAYCTAGSQLKTSVHDLGNVDLTKNGLGSLKTALGKVQASAKTFASEAKSAFAPQATALRNSLSGLQAAIKAAQGQPSLTAVQAIVSSVTQVKTSAGNLQKAISGKCQ